MARLTDIDLDTPSTSRPFSDSDAEASTPATSASARKGKGRRMVIDDSDSDVKPTTLKKLKSDSGSGRSTPRRHAAVKAKGRYKMRIDLESDEEEDAKVSASTSDEDDVSVVSSNMTSISDDTVSTKGKSRVIDLTSEEEDEFEPPEQEQDSDEEMELAGALALIHEYGGAEASKLAQATARAAAEAILASTSQKNIGSSKKVDKEMRKLVKGKPKKAKGFPGKGRKLGTGETEEEEDELDSDSSPLSAVSDNEDVKPAIKKKKRVPTNETKEERQERLDRQKEERRVRRNMPQWQRTQVALERHHKDLIDLWGKTEREHDVIKPELVDQPTGISLKLMPFQLEGLNWMKQQEAGPWHGGLQSDEMGMGKTIQSIALLLSDFEADSKRRTLVVAPTVAIMQWRNEFNKHTTCFKVLVWHGQGRTMDIKELKKYDVVLTSYAVLESSFRRQHSGFKKGGELHKEDSPIHKIKWHRIILDEAHNIKDRACNTAKGAFALHGKFRWCLSGTPLMNRVGELYSMIRFLQLDPMAYYYCKKCPCKSMEWKFSDKRSCDTCKHSPMVHTCLWNQEILKPIQNYGHVGQGAVAFKKLRVLMDRLMLRRTKLERADDLGLPPRTVMVRRDHFTEEEEELYTSLFKDVKRKFSTYVEDNTVLNNYSSIFTLITRMRQMALHPDMVLKSRTAGGISAALAEGASQSIHTCRICLDEAEDPISSKCRHVYCRSCVTQYVEAAANIDCVVCHLPLSIDLEQPAIDEPDSKAAKTRQGMLERIDPSKWRTSSKIEALVEELQMLRSEDSTIKSLVFSQFTSFLDLIARRLQLAGFKYVRLQGNMTPEARDRTIKYFTETTDCTVFLLSLKAGGVALNLVEASRVFVMDPAVELQAMDRVHRIGQRRPVVITRLIIQNSIEAQIIELQRKKEAMVGAALGDSDDGMARLTPEDLSFLFSS